MGTMRNQYKKIKRGLSRAIILISSLLVVGVIPSYSADWWQGAGSNFSARFEANGEKRGSSYAHPDFAFYWGRRASRGSYVSYADIRCGYSYKSKTYNNSTSGYWPKGFDSLVLEYAPGESSNAKPYKTVYYMRFYNMCGDQNFSHYMEKGYTVSSQSGTVHLCNHSYGWSGWWVSGNRHVRSCSRCGAWMQAHNISWSGWNVDGNTHYRVCNGGCGIRGDSHQSSPSEWKSNDTEHWRECSVCGVRVANAAAHSYEYAWKADRTHTKTCKECGKSLEEECTVEKGQCTKCGHYFTTTVTFDDNGGHDGPGVKQLQIGEVYTPSPSPVREGYTFLGWSDSK